MSRSALGFTSYVLATAAVTTAAVYHAVATRKEFYPASIYMTTSKVNILVLSNLVFCIILMFGYTVKGIFLGRLSRDEWEDLAQNGRFFFVETCLALTIFREELNYRTLALCTALLFVKVFHWLATMRVENVARAEDLPLSTHFRLASLLVFLALVDLTFVVTTTVSVLNSSGPSVLFLFVFEYTILTVLVCSLALKYVLLLIDNRMEGRWVNRSTWMFYLEFTGDLIRLFCYICFFVLICYHYGLPIHLLRELYMTFAKLRERIVKFIHYRRITHNMNERFPDATAAEIQAADPTCIICREDMTTAKRLPCTHVFHFHCLRSWLERSRSCPKCRADIPILPTRPLPPLPPHLAAVVQRAQAARAAAQAAPPSGSGSGSAQTVVTATPVGAAPLSGDISAPPPVPIAMPAPADISPGSIAAVPAVSAHVHSHAHPHAHPHTSELLPAAAASAGATANAGSGGSGGSGISSSSVAPQASTHGGTATAGPHTHPHPHPPYPFGVPPALFGAPPHDPAHPLPLPFPPPFAAAPFGFPSVPPPHFHPMTMRGGAFGGLPHMRAGASTGFPLFPGSGGGGMNTAPLFGALHAPPISTPPPADAITALTGSTGSTAAASLLHWQSTQQSIYQLWFENQTILLQHHMEILQMQLSAIQSMYERQLAMQELIASNSQTQSAAAAANGNGAVTAGATTTGTGSGSGGSGGTGISGSGSGGTGTGTGTGNEHRHSVTIGGSSVYLHPPSGGGASVDGTGGSTTSSAVAGLMSRPPIGVLRALSIGTGGSNSGPSSARGSLTVPSSNATTPAPSLAGSPRTSIIIGGDEKQRRGSMNTRHYESIATPTPSAVATPSNTAASPAHHQLRIDPVSLSGAPLASIGASPASSPPVSPGPKDSAASAVTAAAPPAAPAAPAAEAKSAPANN